MSIFKNLKKIHFRHHKKSKHNSLIVGEDLKNYDYIKITHSPRKDKTHKNNEFKHNPNQKDLKKSYYENKIRVDIKSNFADKPNKTWYLSNEDYKEIVQFLNNKKK